MNQFLSFAGALFVVFLSSCSSTGVIPIGDGEYTISKQSFTKLESAVKVKGDVLREANEFCVARGKEMKVLKLETQDGVPLMRYATADLTFRPVEAISDSGL